MQGLAGEQACEGRKAPGAAVRPGPPDPQVRRGQFEDAHPEVTIVVPATLNDRWRAIIPLTVGGVPTTTLGAWDLGALMDELEEIWAPDGG